MGIFYDPTKPAANDRPTNDQSPMQGNFASINTLLKIDHVGFNTATYGQHNQVTLNGNNPPSLPTVTPIIFPNNKDGKGVSLPKTEALIVSGSAAQSGNQNNISGAAGSLYLPMGVIMKWGSFTVTAALKIVTVTFTDAFPNGIFSVVCQSTSGALQSFVAISSKSVTGFVAQAPAQISDTVYYYIALGN